MSEPEPIQTATPEVAACSMCGETPPADATRCPFCEYPLTAVLRQQEAARLRAKFLPNPPKQQPPIKRMDYWAYVLIMLMWPLGSIWAQNLHWAFIFLTILAVIGAGITALVVLVQGAYYRALGYVLAALAGLGLMTVVWVAKERFL